jgi:hypothetical protein
MTMPLYIDKLACAKYLRDGGVEPALAELYAEALAVGLYQEVVQPTDLALAEAKIRAYYKRDMDERNAGIDRKFRTVYWMLGASMAMHAVTLAKLFIIA